MERQISASCNLDNAYNRRKAALLMLVTVLSIAGLCALCPLSAQGADRAPAFAETPSAELGDPVAADPSKKAASGEPDVMLQPQAEASAPAKATRSGLSTSDKPTIAELRALYKALPKQPTTANLWSTAPDTKAYKAGTLSPASLKYSTAYLNLIRRSANLGNIAFDTALNADAAQGALILARLDKGLTHHPGTPANISDELAQAGKDACASSNLSALWGDSYPLYYALQGQMDDEDAGNRSLVGHRSWLLDPYTQTMGIGSAAASEWVYTAVRVFGDSGTGAVRSDYDAQFDFVAWPASGAFLNDLFTVGVPWSVSLNYDKYEMPDQGAKVTLRRVSDGKTWILDAADTAKEMGDEYFSLSDGYGETSCIIFDPGWENLGADEYRGAYTVQVDGLKSIDGKDASISYQVDFDSARIDLAAQRASIAPIKALTFTGSALKPAPTVKLGGRELKAGADFTVSYDNNKHAGKATVTISGKGDYQGEVSTTFTIKKAANPLSIAAKTKTVKASKLKTKARTISGAIAFKKKGAGTITYAKVKSGSSKVLSINKKTGKITVKKGTKKGAYKIKVKVKAAGNADYRTATKTLVVKVKVK